MSAFRLSAKETAQFVRKLGLSNRLTSPLKRQGNGLGNPPVKLASPVSPKTPRMPSDSFREQCKCGIVMTFSWTDKEFAKGFIAGWWGRHSGSGHGRIK
jgi:hypothetical protein